MIDKVITENQYWQIYGLVSAKLQLDKKIDTLHEAYEEIVGSGNEGRFWDYCEIGDEKKIKKHLGYDHISIKKEKKTIV